jgi:hypothetical protein
MTEMNEAAAEANSPAGPSIWAELIPDGNTEKFIRLPFTSSTLSGVRHEVPTLAPARYVNKLAKPAPNNHCLFPTFR